MTVIEDEIMGLSYFKFTKKLNYDKLTYKILLFAVFLCMTASILACLPLIN